MKGVVSALPTLRLGLRLGLGLGLWLGLFGILATPAAIRADEGGGAETPPLLEGWLEHMEINGFLEARSGMRTGGDAEEKHASMAETRLQLEMFASTDTLDFKYKGDLRADGVADCMAYDTREAWVFARPGNAVDLKLGRQVLTWGTGGLVFVNDLFPKDWQSFFIGRDAEYLKAPSTAAKISVFSDAANVDFVYTPKFEPDRYINGEYISHWDGTKQGVTGNSDLVETDTPERWFSDDEFAARVYRNIDSYELALYGYRGYWKSPGGTNTSGRSIFPELNVYGASARGQVGRGIANLEFAYYHSPADERGTNIDVRNSEMRYLAGYAQELWIDCNIDVQFYVEQQLHYDAYRDRMGTAPAKDEFRQVLTVQLTQLLMNQNLTLSLDAYLSPTDRDAYLRPQVQYKLSDRTTASVGANIFQGEYRHTFFGQFHDNTNVYASLRYFF